MKHDFWIDLWNENQIGFHQNSFNRLLVNYWESLKIKKGESVFVPLCGKSRDMAYIVESGHKVIGNELSKTAIESFLCENNVQATQLDASPFVNYESDHYRFHVGDIFDITEQHIAGVPAVYDRAALVALPEPMRSSYVDLQHRILRSGCVILLIALEYEPDVVKPPPFDIRREEIERLYGSWCEVEHIDTISANIKGENGFETAYRIIVQ